jgi:cytochrome c oxidase subunit 2
MSTTGVVGTVDAVFLAIVAFSVLVLIGITVTMIVFVIRFDRRRHPEPIQIEGNAKLEALWIAIPTLIVLGMFYFGYEGYILMRRAPADALTIDVLGRMWSWTFTYENGRTADKLYVPVDRAIKLRLHSADVIHSFYMPAFRVKEDAVPGKENYLWFKPQTVGPADVYCAEYCGQRHAYMLSQVIVMTNEDFEAWYASDQTPEGAPEGAPKAETAAGAALLERQGCLTCHSLGRQPRAIGGGFRGLYGSIRTVIRDEHEVRLIADEEYLERAIREPGAEIVKGKDAVMPPARLSDEEISTIVDYLKGLS